MGHYGEDDQKSDYNADGDFTGSGDSCMRIAQCEFLTEQYGDAGRKFCGGTGSDQCQCGERMAGRTGQYRAYDPQRRGIYEHERYGSDHGLSGSESGRE